MKWAVKSGEKAQDCGSDEDVDCESYPIFKRNNYFYGKLLSASDFQEEQNYFINKQRLKNRLLFGMGIVHGFEVTGGKPAGVIQVSEGFALDGLGREIVLPAKLACDLNKKYAPKDIGRRRDLFVTVRYDETKVDPVPASGGAETNFNMIREEAKVEFEWTPLKSSSLEKIVLAKVTVESKGDKIYVKKIDDSVMVNGVPIRKVLIRKQETCESKKSYWIVISENGETSIVFGDGESGAQLLSENAAVRATYRKRQGEAGKSLHEQTKNPSAFSKKKKSVESPGKRNRVR